MIEQFIRDCVFGVAIGLWASDQGWRRDSSGRCKAGHHMYRRDGDFACAEELVNRWRKRTRATSQA